MTDQIAGRENARHEIAGQNLTAPAHHKYSSVL